MQVSQHSGQTSARGVLSGQENWVFSYELQTITQAVSYGVFKAYNFFGKAQNRIVNQQDTLT